MWRDWASDMVSETVGDEVIFSYGRPLAFTVMADLNPKCAFLPCIHVPLYRLGNFLLFFLAEALLVVDARFVYLFDIEHVVCNLYSQISVCCALPC